MNPTAGYIGFFFAAIAFVGAIALYRRDTAKRRTQSANNEPPNKDWPSKQLPYILGAIVLMLIGYVLTSR